VQISAANMAPEFLKEKYGKQFVFWGGAVNAQKTLPFGTAKEVAAEARKNRDVFGKGGGFVFNNVHNIQATVPVENIMAMLKSATA
jgi:uroporphyrinogen-III decarboxylase